jgi:hypothetical protein
MVQLPKYDARFLDLGEVDILIGYATTMGDLLRQRWAQRELRLNRDVSDLPWEEAQPEIQAAEHEQAVFERLLGAQLLLASWATLEGAVEYCADYVAEQRNVVASIKKPESWPAGHKIKRLPREIIWQQYFDKILEFPFPLADDIATMKVVRLLRNSYAHKLQLDDIPTDADYPVYERVRRPSADVPEQHPIGAESFRGNYPGRVFAELTRTLTQKLRAAVEKQYPHIGQGILFWHRERR